MEIDAAPARRSFLYVPAARPERFAKAMTSGADMVAKMTPFIDNLNTLNGVSARVAYSTKPTMKMNSRPIILTAIATQAAIALQSSAVPQGVTSRSRTPPTIATA